jgi:hypothetical protein
MQLCGDKDEYDDFKAEADDDDSRALTLVVVVVG